jgi:phage shock protein A
MSGTRRKGVFARLGSLFSGMFRLWVKDKEHDNPEVVYEQAIVERRRQYTELKQAVAGILYMRNKLESEIENRRLEIARLHEDVRRALRGGQENLALSLIARKQELIDELGRVEKELETMRSEAAEAKENLMRFREEIDALVNEKGRMMAKLANVQTRRRLRAALDGFNLESEMAALENVREYIAKIGVEGQLEQEVNDPSFRQQLRKLRDDARTEAARVELERLKQEMNGRLIPETTDRVAVAGDGTGVVLARG